ncbi:putative late blight resistance protein homolog R1A-3 [Salvia miltiorrhiza]|uniref:putative late blight resistance protein homolog R1A-3 n=1 Tax=Salvia miltiorrhiza TaxID=226208 RepID=UPI0025AC5024|nr:putative late blight resistance protein homolog R1A-3 [Salvia miltiorrhiza]
MAAAYAALVSLVNTMDQIHIHPRLSASFDNYQFESLRGKVDFFLDFVENYSDAVRGEKVDFLEDSDENHPDANNKEAEDLARRIAVSAHDAEDIIELEAADRIHASSTEKNSSFLPDLQRIIQDMDFIKEKVIKVKEEIGFINSMDPPPSSSSAPLAAAKTTSLVGFDGYIEQLLDELTGHDHGRRIIPIVGMGGIGKTTLATNVYENSNIVRHFNVRVWVTVSQEFSARKFFLKALSSLGISTDDRDSATDQQLSHELYKILFNRRYLIILDDVWSVEAWDKIKFFFPENKNRSRIVVTTRESKLVDYLGSSALAVDFLDDKNSWDLFCANTFASKQGCPSELEEAGKKIVNKCKGLPLAIVVIGGLLRKSSKSQEYWEKIAREEHLHVVNSEPLNILYLSYKYLPVCLKLCVLYLGLCSNYSVEMSELVKLWVAEGFIKPKKEQSLEEVAEGYIDELVQRNLVLLTSVKLNRKIDSYGVHDLVRDLCTRIAERENVFCVQRDQDGRRRVTIDQKRTRFYSQETLSIERPIITGGRRGAAAAPRLRVMVRDMRRLDYTFPEVNSRFLYHEPDDEDEYGDMDPRDYWIATYNIPSSISLLWSLQTIIVKEIADVVAPSEIWEMPQLRHIKMSPLYIPDPPPRSDAVVLNNLQTLSDVENLVFTEDVCNRIPNVKELVISYYFHERGEASSRYHLHDVGRLSKLETLDYSCKGWKFLEDSSRGLKRLPSSIKELSLRRCKLDPSDVTVIGSLPQLELLVLHKVVLGEELNLGEEEFVCLKHLRIDGCDDLKCWTADSCNFPVLERLSLVSLPNLDEIPSAFAEIPTLERISIHDCSESACISAINILEEKESFGHLSLHLQIKYMNESAAEMLREKVEYSSQNLLIEAEIRSADGGGGATIRSHPPPPPHQIRSTAGEAVFAEVNSRALQIGVIENYRRHHLVGGIAHEIDGIGAEDAFEGAEWSEMAVFQAWRAAKVTLN